MIECLALQHCSDGIKIQKQKKGEENKKRKEKKRKGKERKGKERKGKERDGRKNLKDGKGKAVLKLDPTPK